MGMRRERHASRGFGLVNILITLAVLGGLLFFLLKMQRKSADRLQEQISTRDIPAGVVPSGGVVDSQSLQKAVQIHLQKRSLEGQKRLECADGTAGAEGACSP